LHVIDLFLFFIEKAQSRRGEFIEQLLGGRSVLSSLECSHMVHLSYSRIVDHVPVYLKGSNPEQDIMIRRLPLGGDAKPFPIGI
tara:strand:+ start:1974 stop:2225 length:252 start_codon:yes stop_codon:yes gene_type:complete